jgi:dienelactone hydrolase
MVSQRAHRQREGFAPLWPIGALLIATSLAVVPDSAAAVSVRDIVEVTDFSGLSASLDGRHVVFRVEHPNIQRNSYDFEWYAVDVPSGRVGAIASGGDPVYDDPGLIRPGQPFWASNDAVIFPSFVDGVIGLWRAKVDGSQVTPLVVQDSNIEKVSLSPDGGSILYSLGPSREGIKRAEANEYNSGTLVDGSVDLWQSVFRGGSIDGRMATQRLSGYWFIRDGLLWRSPRQQWKFDLRTGANEPVGKPESAPDVTVPKVYAGLTTKASDGSSAEASWDDKIGSLRATIAGTKRSVSCGDSLCSGHASWLTWIPASHRLAIGFTDGNRRQTLAVWDVDAGNFRRVASSDGLLSGDRSPRTPCAVTETAAFCVTSAAAAPPRLERIDLASGLRTVLFDPNQALRSTYSPTVEQLTWKSEGTTYYGTLLTKATIEHARRPLFINFYWCDGFLRGGGEGDSWPIPSLLDAGFAAVCINLPPSGIPQNAIAEYGTALTGVRALVSDLRARRLIDPDRVGMGGFSHGSEIAMWTATKSRLLSAVAISSAQFEPSSYWAAILGAKDREKAIRSVWHLGDPDKTPAAWKLQAPALNTDKLTAPILFQMPEQEAHRIPELLVRLNRSGTPAELYAFPDEDHLFVQPRHEEARYSRNLDWFRYWLQSVKDPDPAKAEQYRRWDLLKSAYCRTTRSARATACSK